MKNLLYLPMALLLLAACSGKDADVEPQAVVTAFDQDFTLQYRQVATLPQASQPEMTVRLDDLQFSICPSNARCSFPDHVLPTLAISGRDGQTQLLKLPSSGQLIVNSQYPDTTSVWANGRRYVVYYKSWGGTYDQDKPAREDFRLTFRVTKP